MVASFAIRCARCTRSVAITIALSAGASAAAADEPTRARDIGLKIGGNGLYDAGFAALAGGVLFGSTYVISPSERGLPPLDGLGRRDFVAHLDRAGDYSLRLGVGFGITLALVTDLGQGRRGFEALRGPLVVAEGALAASAFTQLLKNVLGVCRPRDWEPETRQCGVTGEDASHSDAERRAEAHRSFPSGHNAPLAGIAGASLGLYLLPTDRRPEYLPVALTATGFALTTVILREQAGAHSWVDTGAAFVTGGAAGFVTALLHMTTTRAPAAAHSSPSLPPPLPIASFAGAFLRPNQSTRTPCVTTLRATAHWYWGCLRFACFVRE